MDDNEGRRERRWRDAAVAGDAAAWRSLFDGAYDRVRAHIHWRLGGRDPSADDVEQEVWLVAVRRLADFDPAAGPFVGWVRGITTNVVRRHLRTRLRAAARIRPLGDAEPMAVAVADGDAAERVAVALATLPDRYESVLRAKYLDGLSVEAIAAAWGTTAKAVESLLVRARHAFRAAYSQDAEP